MKICNINVLYRYFNKSNFKSISTLNIPGNGLNLIKTLTPKQLGKIAIDVSKCANSDIKIWDTFVKSSQNSLNLFDFKDTIRTLKGLDSFYLYLNYEIRNSDIPFIENLMERLFECCDSYNCSELSEVAEIISKFVISNNSLVDPNKLFTKVSVLFKIRLAEANPSDVVRLSVSYSKVGICDKTLMDTLVKFSLSNNSFTVDEFRTLCTSCAILGYSDKKLLDKICNIYEKSEYSSLNDLAVLSFILSKSSYTNEKVIKIFERGLKNDFNSSNIDIPNFCINLHKLGVKIPEKIINQVDIQSLEKDLLTELLDLFANFQSKQSLILEKFKNIERTQDINIRVLEYITKGKFTTKSHELFKLVISDGFNYLTDTRYIELLTKLPINWLINMRWENYNYDNINTENIPDLVLIQSSIISFTNVFKNDLMNRGKIFSGTIHYIQNNMMEMEMVNNISILETLLNLSEDEKEQKIPHILFKDIENLLDKEIEVRIISDKFKVLLIKDTQTIIIPISPEDLLDVEGEQTEYYLIPPGKVPKIKFLSKLYYITSMNYKTIPISYHKWNKLFDKESKLKYLYGLLN